MPLECQLPVEELKEAYCDPDQAPEHEFVESVLHLIEESLEFTRLVATLNKNNVRLVSIDFASYPFTETRDFLRTVSITDFTHTNDVFEEWALPFQNNIVDELKSLAPVFAVETERPDLVVLGALRLNRLFNAFLREVTQSRHLVGLRGQTQGVYRCLTSRPLDYNQTLRRRLHAPIETSAAKLYDHNDNARIVRFEVRYDSLPLVKVVDGDEREPALEFGWESLLTPPYEKIQGVSWRNSPQTALKLQELACMIPRALCPIAFPASQPDTEEFAAIALPILDDTLCFMRKFEQLKKHNLKLALINTYRTPHEVYEEDFAKRITSALGILVSFDAYLERYIAEQKKMPVPHDDEGSRYYCQSVLEDAEYDQLKGTLELPAEIVDELKKYAQYVPIPENRFDLVVAAMALLADSARGTLHGQRVNAVTVMEPGYRLAIRGLQDDITRFESANGRCIADFGNVRVIDNAKSSEAMIAWPMHAPHPVDEPVYVET